MNELKSDDPPASGPRASAAGVIAYRVGDAVVTKIPELTLEAVSAGDLFPGAAPAEREAATRELDPASVDGATCGLRLSVHAWLVRTSTRKVLIDAGAGAGKTRSGSPAFHGLDESFLERLAAAGACPEEIDAVLHTHLHVDHVGWNTRRIDGRWVPTFPNARYIFSRREHAYLRAMAEGDAGAVGEAAATVRAEAGLCAPAALPDHDFLADSIAPVIAAGLAREVAVDGAEVEPGFVLHPTPGHSIDHASIGFVSRGERALFWGDVMHSPLQFARPDWNSAYCEFPDAARAARRWAMADAADTGALVLTTHFAGSSAGRASRAGGGFAWRFA